MAGATNKSTILRDLLLACVFAAAMAFVWGMRDWTNLSHLILPDTDDMLRLQQIRDWIAGQGFHDLTQYRLGDGVAMHWSRVDDLVPAAIIVILRPLVGAHGAELITVLSWPVLLFGIALFIAARIARRLAGDEAALPAILLGLVAFPMTAMFLPGRIDHTALQIVCVLGIGWALTVPPTMRSGMVAGALAVASLAIGMETIVLIAAAAAITGIGWLRGDAENSARMSGFGTGILLAMLAALLLFRPLVWPAGYCDSMTPPVTALALTGGGLMAALGLAGPALTLRRRWFAAIGAGLILAVALPVAAPACLAGPYGMVGPDLNRLWLSQVAEAKPLWHQPPGTAFGYVGMMLAGVIVSGWRARKHPEWRALLAMQAAGLAVTLLQARAAPPGAALALPALAAWIATLRGRQPLPRVLLAWLASCGILYGLIGAMIPTRDVASAAPAVSGGCLRPADLAALNTLPTGRILAPLDMGSYILATSHHTVLAGPYHREGDAILDTLRFYRGNAASAHAIVQRRRIDYVIACRADSGAPGTMDAALIAGNPPPWLAALPPDGNLRVYRVRR